MILSEISENRKRQIRGFSVIFRLDDSNRKNRRINCNMINEFPSPIIIKNPLPVFIYLARYERKKGKKERKGGKEEKRKKSQVCVRSLSAELHALVREANRF